MELIFVILFLKQRQNNFNAIRCSHYPNVVEFYQVCDYMGLYVVDEANVECHGVNPLGRLAMDFMWAKCIQQRIIRMVQRDLNFTSIIIWSLGNESGQGWNFYKARNALLKLDTTRPVQYEGGGSFFEGTGTNPFLTDIICPMYTTCEELQKQSQSQQRVKRPIILCEYSHSMGNSNGNISKYWKEHFWNDSQQLVQGGFIWDMMDQGLSIPNDNSNFFGYGGDFSHAKYNDGYFCLNVSILHSHTNIFVYLINNILNTFSLFSIRDCLHRIGNHIQLYMN